MDLSQQLIAIIVVLGVLFGLLWVMKRKGWAHVRSRGRRGPTARLEVLDHLVLTPHHSIHLIQLADRTLLVGLSPNGCNLLESAPAQGIPAGEKQL